MRAPAFGAFALAALGVLLSVGPTLAAAGDFPSGYEAYHTYAEVTADLDTIATAHPAIARKFSIGRSYEGRTIWALKISDSVSRDEAEPEVLFEANIHAREHLTVEMALYVAHLLVDDYGDSSGLGPRLTNIVDTREIFIVPLLNPDGAEYDIAASNFQDWRKNRQPTAGSSAIGVDLNRNFGYEWGCCLGSSANPKSGTYRGPTPWSAPETRALRDFVRSRVVGGVQQIRTAISWHSYDELVMWPFGFTKTDIVAPMNNDDHSAFVALGRGMAARNGYHAEQLSDIYPVDGDATDWMYGEQHIFAFLVEMYPKHTVRGPGGFHPPASAITRETARNREAVLYLLEQSDCPYRAAGLATRHC